MAGGMNKRGEWGAMTDRLAQGRHDAPVPPPALKHCWVTDANGRLPALLLGWRRVEAGGWEGRVARAVPARDGRWDLVEEWLPASMLDAG